MLLLYILLYISCTVDSLGILPLIIHCIPNGEADLSASNHSTSPIGLPITTTNAASPPKHLTHQATVYEKKETALTVLP